MRTGKGWWPWVAAGAAAVGLVVLLVVTAIPLGGREGLQTSANTAQLTALLIAAGTAAVGVMVWAWRITRVAAAITIATLTRVKDELAEVVAEQWKDEARLRSLDDPDPIPVQWRTPVQTPTVTTALMDHPANIETGPEAATFGVSWTASSNDIDALADRFRRTRRRRLVILGGPGTGKTTLAMQLLLHLLATRTTDEPVPVLLPVAGWDTEQFPRLHDWLADRLARDYPTLRSPKLGFAVVRALTARGHILPVLDGLDELPPSSQGEVISALNRSLGGDDQLILTSRTTEFTAAITVAGDVVTSAAVLEPCPLDPAAAADYLTHWLPPYPGSVWQQILTDLRDTPPPPDQAGPGSAVSRRGAALAGVASTPLGLWLLRSVYSVPGADPAELADPARFPEPAVLQAHLFDQLIPALIATRLPSDDSAEPFRPLFRPRRHHDPGQVRRWLGYLAHHLTCQPAMSAGDDGRETRDFVWWRLAATTHAITLTTALALVLIVVLAFGFMGGLIGVLGGALVLYKLETGLRLGLLPGLVIVLTAWFWMRDSPGYADMRIRQRSSELLGNLVLGLVVGLTFGVWLMSSRALPIGPVGGLTLGLVGGLVGGFVRWTETPTRIHHATTPMGSWRADRTLSAIRLSTIALTFGIGGGLVFGIARVGERAMLGVERGHTGGLVVGFMAGLVIGLAIGLAIAIGFGKHRAWLAYLVATCRLARAGLLPRHLMPFLDDCHRLGLLRAVGPIYQFRHAEFQDHLAVTYQQQSAFSPIFRRRKLDERSARK